MADDFVQGAPDSGGKKVATQTHTRSGSEVHRQEVISADPTNPVALGKIMNSPPDGSEYAPVVRPIPSGVQAVKNAQLATSGATWTNATAPDTALTITPDGDAIARISLTRSGSVTNGEIHFESKTAAGVWIPSTVVRLSDRSLQTLVLLNSLQDTEYMAPIAGSTQFRIRLAFAIEGTGSITVEITPSAAALAVTAVPGTQPVSIADAASPLGYVAEAAWSGSGSGSVIAVLKGIMARLALPVSTVRTEVANAPAQVSVGVASGALVSANANRKGLEITNASAAAVSLHLAGGTAVLYSGVTLFPGQTWTMDAFTFTAAAVTAIASAAASAVGVQEYE